jgi:hypothetical protein
MSAKRKRKKGTPFPGTRCAPCGKLSLPEDVAARIHAKLIRARATRHFEMWPCPVKPGRFHLGRKPIDAEA